MKVKTTEYGTTKEILKYQAHHVAIAAMIDDTGITANADGKKIVPAGTLVTGLGDDVVVLANDDTTQGIILSDVDVTHGKAPCAVVVHGFIDLTKIPEAPEPDAIAALPMIKFL